MTANLVCIAVFEWVALVVNCGHQHVVKSRDTATSSFAKIDVILNTSTEKVRSEVTARVDSIDG